MSWIKGFLVVAWLFLLCILVLHWPWLCLGLPLLVFSIWQFSVLVSHQVDLGILHFTCYLLDMSSSGLWAFIFLGKLVHLASWELVQVHTTFIYGLWNKFLLTQKKNQIYPCARSWLFQVGILWDWLVVVNCCTIHLHFGPLAEACKQVKPGLHLVGFRLAELFKLGPDCIQF